MRRKRKRKRQQQQRQQGVPRDSDERGCRWRAQTFNSRTTRDVRLRRSSHSFVSCAQMSVWCLLACVMCVVADSVVRMVMGTLHPPLSVRSTPRSASHAQRVGRSSSDAIRRCVTGSLHDTAHTQSRERAVEMSVTNHLRAVDSSFAE